MSVRFTDTLATPKSDLHRQVDVSFRDPAGNVVISNDRVFRVVNRDHQQPLQSFLESELFRSLVGSGVLVQSRYATDVTIREELKTFTRVDNDASVIEHEHISFPTYPYEWSPEMLFAAGELTLDLMERLLPQALGLKDASPYNVLFKGAKPIFIDLLSIERRDPLDPTWLPFAQFIRNFIQPLLVSKYFTVGLDQTFRVYRDGLQPEQVFRMCGVWRKMRPPFLTLVSLPAALSRMNPNRYQRIYAKRQAASMEQARFILGRQLKGLRRKLSKVRPSLKGSSMWTNYVEHEHHRDNLEIKENFVRHALRMHRPRRVLDVGCNVGHFSLLAAGEGAEVLAIDRDAVVIGKLWRRVAELSVNVLPLVVDITRPTAGLGWRNRECRAFLERSAGHFDCVFMLAIIHHILVTERIPLNEIFKLLKDLTTNLLIVEFIAPDDPLFRLVTRGNHALYEYLSTDIFEAAFSEFFTVERKERIGTSARWLYQLRRLSVA